MSGFRLFALLSLAVLLLLSETLFAACGMDPAGTIRFNTGTGRLQFCSNTTWVDFSTTTTSAGGSCTEPGRFEYYENAGTIMMRYCGGTFGSYTWRRTSSSLTDTTATCTFADKGRFYYGGQNKYWYCTGSRWRSMN